MFYKFIRSISFVFILSTSYTQASHFSLSEGIVEGHKENVIEYTHSWKKVRKLSSDIRKVLGLSFSDRKLDVLEARFVFYIQGDAFKYNNDFYSRRATLEGFSGMRHYPIAFNKYIVQDSNMGIDLSAEVSLEYDLDYSLLKSAFNYRSNKEESFVVHQKGRKFNRILKSTDIISHVQQSGDYVKVTIDSYAVLLKKGASRYLSFAIKKFMVKKMKKQIVQAPLVYLNY